MGQHSGGRDGAAEAAVAIARVNDAGSAEGRADAVFAHMAVAKQGGCYTEEPIVVQRVNHGNVRVLADAEDGGRKRGKPIVDMNNVWAEFGKCVSELST